MDRIIGHFAKELVPCLIIAAAAWCGFCARPTFFDSSVHPLKGKRSQSIDDVDKGNRCGSIDNTSYGGGCCSISDIPFSQSLGDHVSDLPDEHVFDTSKGKRSQSIDDVDKGNRCGSIDNTSYGGGCCSISDIPFSQSLGDHVSDLPDEHVSDTSKGKRSQSIDDVDKGNRCGSIDNTSYGGGCCSISDIPFSQSLGDHVSDLPDEHVSDTSKGKRSQSIDDVDKGNRCGSIDNTSYGGGCCLISDIPFSQSLGDHVSDLPDEHVSDTSKGSRSRSIDDIDTGARCRSIDDTSYGGGCCLISDIPFSQSLMDHISDLPDGILFNILSRLSLRDVMRAAVLSKRWRNVCSALPYLDLDWPVLSGSPRTFHSDKCEPYRGAYLNNADQVLQRYKDQDILSLRLSCCYTKEFYSVVSRWMDFAATRENLVSLNLQFTCPDSYSFKSYEVSPDELYIISGAFLSRISLLKDLYLDLCILKLQGDRLSKLVTLSLNFVVLEGTEWQCVLSSLSNIQRLQLKKCNLPVKLRFGANLCRLSALMIFKCPDLLEVELNAKNLKTFEYFGEVAVKCSYLCVPKLENMFVYLAEKDFNGEKAMFSNLAYSLPSLRTLFLGGNYPQLHNLPTSPAILFRSVSMLQLAMKNDDPEADLVQDLPRLLRCFPLLKQLNVVLPIMFWRRKQEKPPKPYLHHHLKDIELGEFLPVWSEFARFLLASVVILERLVLKKSIRAYVGSGDWFKNSARYSDHERKRIHELLDGVATISPSACVIVDGD